jgi:hypothetical protein
MIWKKILDHIQLVAVLVAAVLLVIIVGALLSNKKGSNLYVVETQGEVSYAKGTSNEKPLKAGTKLSVDDIVITGEKASCVLSYEKKAKIQSNYVYIGENSQVAVYNKHKDTGGYDMHLTYGSLICKSPNRDNTQTMLATPVYQVTGNDSIIKLDYDSEESKGFIYTFAGNPSVQIIQRSGVLGNPDKLVKNSCCVVQQLDDGTIGYGAINSDLYLNKFSAQDLKAMAGIAGVHMDLLSYTEKDFEQAYLTAYDSDRWLETKAARATEADTLPATEATFATDEAVPLVNTENYGNKGTTAPITTISEKRTTMSDYTRYSPLAITEGTTVPADEEEDIHTKRTTTGKARETEHTTTKKKSGDVTTIIIVQQGGGDGTKRTTTAAPPAGTQYNPTPTSSYTSSTQEEKPVIVTEPPKPTHKCNSFHKVVFTYSIDGIEFWSLEVVKCGYAAHGAETPVIPGKIFVGWDKDISDIRGDMEVHALFENDPNYSGSETHVVTTAEWQNTTTAMTGNYYYPADTGVITTTAPYNTHVDYATAPATTTAPISSIFDQPAETISVTHTVSFYANNVLIESHIVPHGGSVECSTIPASTNGQRFIGWSKDTSNVQSDMVVIAMYASE